jgi:uncharacterized protein (TIGR03437 family)
VNVTVGGQRASCRNLISGDDAYYVHFDIQLPADLPVGPTTLVVTTTAGRSAPFPITVGSYAPALIDPYFSRSALPPALPLFNSYNPCAIQQTVAPGEILTAFAVGLGATDADGATLAKPSIQVGEQVAEVLESVAATGQGGIYRLTFRVPPGDGLLPVVVTIGGQASAPTLLPVGNILTNRSSLGLRRAAAESIVEPSLCANLLGGLLGATVKVKDSTGVERIAPYVDASWYVVPSGTANGLATVTVTSSAALVSGGYLDIRTVAPASFLFSPFVTGYIVRVRNGVRTVEAARGSNGTGEFQIDMGPDTDQVYLILLSTGLRNRSSLRGVQVLIGDQEAPVEYVGPQSEVAGLDQMNVLLPRSLAGRGRLILQYTVDGIPDNILYADNFIYLEFK